MFFFRFWVVLLILVFVRYFCDIWVFVVCDDIGMLFFFFKDLWVGKVKMVLLLLLVFEKLFLFGLVFGVLVGLVFFEEWRLLFVVGVFLLCKGVFVC